MYTWLNWSWRHSVPCGMLTPSLALNLNQSANYQMNFQHSNLYSPKMSPPSHSDPQFEAVCLPYPLTITLPFVNNFLSVHVVAGEFGWWGSPRSYGGGTDLANWWRVEGHSRYEEVVWLSLDSHVTDVILQRSWGRGRLFATRGGVSLPGPQSTRLLGSLRIAKERGRSLRARWGLICADSALSIAP